ncbi:prepilin-type N-terminal cleavage/methylation domain-containing protein [Campylobacter sp.]|uniref:prepilin-type N-terminal cleavage/methylation domain-containing protein n=1 Tax=Campylobacter sp. TaxID=205 RepID=UPI002AA749BF|nr:prepilin-type N-terminal cleavage/methylation domain-containing protein [Campylobacter sp.]MCI7447218.1 prepilin-type N-terminal cleavage/methylation domain-containing protein [Campylobacter sp.]
MKKAFTLVELVFVVVVIGILSFALWPTKQPTQALEAARQIVAHIRYTQHLALNDDKFATHTDTGGTDSIAKDWYKRLWRISFSDTQAVEKCDSSAGWRYAVYQNIADDLSDKGQPNGKEEAAMNPAEPGKRLSGCYSNIYQDITNNMNLTKTYGILSKKENNKNEDGLNFDEFGTQGIIFDELGRAYPRGKWDKPYNDSNKFKQDNGSFGRIKLKSKDGSTANILVFAETGYACVENVDLGCEAPATNP